MAIAYFIPDQAQLLARSNQQSAQQAAAASAGAVPQQQQQQQQQQPRQPQPQTSQQQQQQQQRPQFRANISVPLGRQQGAMSMSEFGCWDLLAQIFCYALRIYSYNSSQRRPTVIQISFEIRSGSQQQEQAPDSQADVTDATGKGN
ncbi:cell death protein Grim [Drosophila guanche]|uniref:Blast:Cell death protein Grim n=1 Tax=Drosophila guanche TaxID=7266 RepID=A0A3B0J5P8_DROGU|nr:cell death protein Grim [Drosophila guanche]SPP77015.1 blast:Cell death protein Grim [Drosophila guanche]